MVISGSCEKAAITATAGNISELGKKQCVVKAAKTPLPVYRERAGGKF